MTTIGKARLKKLLTKGLTGWEAGALIFREGLEREWGKQGYLTDSDIETIRNSLKTNEDREAYNRFLDTAILVDRITHQACEGGLVVITDILKAKLFLADGLWHWRTMLTIHSRPVIVTQKQYEDLTAERKVELFKKLWSLKEVIEERITHLAGWELINEWEESGEDTPNDFVAYVKESYSDIYLQALKEITSLIRKGKLHLVNDKGKPARGFPDKPSAQELELIQEKAFISGADLYGSGLPEWVEEIDIYKVPYKDVVIIQNPGFYQLDEKDYYKDPEKEYHDDPYFYGAVNKNLIKKGTSYTQLTQGLITKTKNYLTKFLAFKTAIGDFYRLMGLKKFGGNLETCYQNIISELESLNDDIKKLRHLEDLKLIKEPIIVASKLETIDITKLKPEAECLKRVRGWITKEGLGDNWWKKGSQIPEDGEEEGGEEAEKAG
jgi:hypothetical protein